MGFLDNNGLGTLWGKIVGKSVPYGYCTTGSSTKAKTVTVSPAITALETGMTIAVRFQYSNTATSPTLNVNGLGAKAIYRYGTTVPGTSASASWNANAIHTLTYNGSGWVLNNWNNTTYSGMTDAEYQAGTSETNRLITPARLKAAIQYWATGEANVQSDWEQTDSAADDYIKNKPTIPTDASEIAYDSRVSVATAISANTTAISNKVDKETGKGLSTNDYTTAEQTKLAGIATGAEANVQADWNESDSTSDAYINNKPTNVSAFTNDVGYLRSYTETDPTVPSWAKASTKPSYTASEVGAQPTLVSGTNIKTINGNSILGSGNLVVSGGGSEPTMQTLSVTSGGSGTWHYRTWPSGWQEAWYRGSITFSNASSTAGGWNRSTKNFALPISFADDASILVSGATSGRVFTHGGIKTNGTQFEAQILGGAALAANTYSGWNVYVAGYGRS